jgi:hypothetical protein
MTGVDLISHIGDSMMKNLCLSLICGAIVLGLSADDASARSQYKKAFIANYNLAEPSNDTETALAAAFKTGSCYTCHYKDKKKRNEYGEALQKLLPKYSKDRWKAEKDACNTEVFAAFKKLETQTGAHGKTFGEKLKAGELPTAVIKE